MGEMYASNFPHIWIFCDDKSDAAIRKCCTILWTEMMFSQETLKTLMRLLFSKMHLNWLICNKQIHIDRNHHIGWNLLLSKNCPDDTLSCASHISHTNKLNVVFGVWDFFHSSSLRIFTRFVMRSDSLA